MTKQTLPNTGAQSSTPKPRDPVMVARGKLGAGRPKHFSPEEIERRKQRLADAREIHAAKLAAASAKVISCLPPCDNSLTT